MATYDFTGYSNFSNDPLRADQLRLASMIDLDTIRVLRGPPGGNGFRKGMWTVIADGTEYHIFDNPAHAASLDDQDSQVKRTTALHIAALQSGYIKA